MFFKKTTLLQYSLKNVDTTFGLKYVHLKTMQVFLAKHLPTAFQNILSKSTPNTYSMTRGSSKNVMFISIFPFLSAQNEKKKEMTRYKAIHFNNEKYKKESKIQKLDKKASEMNILQVSHN